ncbi:MAG: glutathione S-transferase family protein [Candidatus Binataceae bacterium]
MSQLRIFSYLPNPRIWKATIVARLCGVDLDLRGASPRELQSWLWDFNARPLSADDETEATEVSGHAGFQGKLRKTTAFLERHPFGTVPAAFSPDGKVGIFESNSIMRAVARLADNKLGLYGRDPYEASRIDSFLDASLVFARDSQIYLLALGGGSLTEEIYNRCRDAFAVYMDGINAALLAGRGFIVGDHLTLADVCFVAEFALFHNEKPRARHLKERGLEPILSGNVGQQFPDATAHFARLSKHPAFAPDVVPYMEKIERAKA